MRGGALVSVIRWSASHRFLVITVSGLLAIAGILTIPAQRLDAVPDISDTQVILYAKWDQPPDLLERQVTYPVSTALLGAPRVRSVRGFTDVGFALIYVLFEDGTDLYWARSRVAELLSKTGSILPPGALVEMGPDATGVGWVFQYALVDDTGKHSLADLRALQDWNLKYVLQATPGVAEVASVGGFEKTFQVTVLPSALEQYNLTFKAIVEAVRNSSMDTGAEQIDFSGRSFTVRGRGLAHTVEDLQTAVVYAQRSKMDLNAGGVPLLLRDVARIELLPKTRNGVTDLNGKGESVGGIVVMRQGQNALEVIQRIKKQLSVLQQTLPEGVRIIPAYDRSDLILRSIDTFKWEMLLAAFVVSLVILLFLRHLPSAFVAVAIIPATLLTALIPMYWFGVNLNIMSLGGIVLSIGVLVDGAIIEVENVYRRVRLTGGGNQEILAAIEEVAPAVFLSLLTITVTFFPIFALTGQEGCLFQPLAAAKTIVMATAALLTITLAPALRMLFSQKKPKRLERSEEWPLRKISIYEPALRLVLKFPKTTIWMAILLVAATIPVYFRLGREFMPPLNEETVLYMPTMLPGVSAAQALEVLQRQDVVLASFPEVARVYGKAGRAETATDPAPLSMIETTLILKPREQWRERHRWYSGWSPEWLKNLLLRRFASDRISYDSLISEMDKAVSLPGVANSWTMPIRGRTDMLTTGARTPVAVRVLGPDLKIAQEIAQQIETTLKRISGTRSAFAERATDGYFLDIQVDRDRLATHGLQVGEVQEVIAGAIGGAKATELFQERGRYPVAVRYPKRFRVNLQDIGQITVLSETGERVPLKEIATIQKVRGPGMIRTENGLLTSYVYVDAASDNIGRYVEEAQKQVSEKVRIPPGYSVQWTGEYENMMRARKQLQVVVPGTLLLLLGLLYLNTKSWTKTAIIVTAVPFSLVGAVWLLYSLGYNMSVATWVGMIALVGLDAETGVFMLLFLDLAYEEAKRRGSLEQAGGLANAIVDGAAKRLRPKLMTVTTAFIGLLPAMLAMGSGADVAKRIVAPMVGGLASSFVLELLVYPPLYLLWKRGGMKVQEPDSQESGIQGVQELQS
jgi:Cu(I)/Ag(I) efflux system membrane protein CusA/SilA